MNTCFSVARGGGSIWLSVEWPDTLILFACDHQVSLWSLSMIWLRSLSPMASVPREIIVALMMIFLFYSVLAT